MDSDNDCASLVHYFGSLRYSCSTVSLFGICTCPRVSALSDHLSLISEATSTLDVKTEASVHGAIEKIAGSPAGPIVIAIAHRLSKIRNTDVIHVMDQGKVLETGTHTDLLRQRGKYRELVQAQL